MKINRYDTFFFGATCAFVFVDFLNKDFIGAAIKGFIMGLYLGFNYTIDKFEQQKEGEQ
jgi:hypothetical protein